MTHPLVELSGIAKRFEALEVLSEIELRIQSGESIAILGPSGSGKSTLLNIIGGLLPPTEGRVLFDDVDLFGMTADELASFRSRQMGYIFQAHHLLPQCTALENVLIPTLVLADREQRRKATPRARTLLTEVGLGDRLGHRPSRLSGGECQRVAVVRALINKPRLILADEPTGSLDAVAADQLGELLCELNEKEATTLVTVTHSERLAARMQKSYELRNGKLATLSASR